MNISGYQLGREVEVGEFCSVYSALELESSKTVSIRVFQQQLTSNPDFCQHLKKVSRQILNKNIGNIIPLKQVVIDSTQCYIITDYFPCSQNQQPLLTEFTIDEVLNFGLQIANSLSQIHTLGLVHGGVSRSNLIFPNFSEVTLGSSSFQRTFKKKTAAFSLPVSLNEAAYIAPEFSKGLNPSSDFYSLGIVLFELLFKIKPFVADTLQQLQLNKESMLFEVPNKSAERLIPLFQQLFDINPQQRISNVTDYIKVTEQCGYAITRAEASNEKILTPTITETTNELKTSNNKFIIAAGIMGLLLIAIAFYSFTGNPPEKNTITYIAPTKKIIKEKKAVRIIQPDNKNIANTLYLESQQQIADNNYGTALMSINNALKEQADHSAALKLKKQIELEFEIRAYLSRAEKLIAQRKLTRPEKDNALLTYKQLAVILPAGDDRARKGLQKITDRYYQLANNLVLKNEFVPAKQYIASGLTIIPDYPSLIQLDLYITQQENKLLAQQEKLKAQRIDNKKKQAELLQQKKFTKEKARIAAVEKENQLRIKQQNERERLLQIQKAQQQADNKISSANNLLNENNLSQQSILEALKIHEQLINLNTQDSKTVELFNQIISSYGTLANQQIEAENLAEALITINQGLALDRKNSQLLKIKNKLTNLITEVEKKKNQVPVIGTF